MSTKFANSFDDIIGTSPAMQKVFDIIQQVAGSEVDVLVGGETGSLDPHITSSFASGLATGGTSDEDLAWFDSRGPRQYLDRILPK